jgi:hypothetical protein
MDAAGAAHGRKRSIGGCPVRKSDEELLAEAAALDALYAEAAAFDALRYDEPPEDWEDEMEDTRQAGLNMGRP